MKPETCICNTPLETSQTISGAAAISKTFKKKHEAEEKFVQLNVSPAPLTHALPTTFFLSLIGGKEVEERMLFSGL